MDDTMMYSSAIFKSENEDPRTAQMRKISLLIEKVRSTGDIFLIYNKKSRVHVFFICSLMINCGKFQARIEKNHEVLEMGCGWGTFAIEVVKRTGCKYTGITLSIEQLKYAKAKVKEAGLQVLV
jgi:cyclopropane-fatty-acyl-phospholipid synthase